MTSSIKSQSANKVLANELLMFWRLSHYVQAFVRPGWELPPDITMEEVRDEIDLLGEMTDWHVLKVACRRLLLRADSALQAVSVG